MKDKGKEISRLVNFSLSLQLEIAYGKTTKRSTSSCRAGFTCGANPGLGDASGGKDFARI